MPTPGINYHISTTAEVRALKEVERELQRQIVAARAAGKSILEYSHLTDQLGAAQRRLRDIGLGGRLRAEILDAAQSFPILGRAMQAINGGAALASTSLLGLTAAAMAIRKGLSEFSKIEDIQTTFTTLLGSKSAANTRMRELADFAAKTPFNLNEIAAASRVLENLTAGALSTGQGLRIVGDTAAAVNAPFEEVAVTLGRLYAGLRDGTPVGEYAQRMTQLTGINFSQAKSWEAVTAALSKYNGEMERRSATASGKESTLGDAWNMMWAQIGRPYSGAYKSTLSALAGFFEGIAKSFQKVYDRQDREREALDSLHGVRQEATAASPAIQRLASSQETAADRADRLAKAISQITAPIEAMSAAADTAAASVKDLSHAQLELQLAKIDNDRARGLISDTDAAYMANAARTNAELNANYAEAERAAADLSAKQAAAKEHAKKLNLAMMLSIFHPSPENAREYEEAASIQEQLDAAVRQAQQRLDAISIRRSSTLERSQTADMEIWQKEQSTAQAKSIAAEEEKWKRRLLALQIEINEARQRGDEAAAARAEALSQWLAEYKRVWEDTQDDPLARRAANATLPAADSTAPTAHTAATSSMRPQADRLAQIGGFVGSAAAPRDRSAEENTKKTARTAKATETIAAKIQTTPDTPATF